MKIIKQETKRFYLGTTAGHVLVILEVNETAKVVNGTIGLYHYALLLPTRKDLANFLYNYLQSGERFIGASDHHVSEAVYVEDPEGNGIEIYVDRPDTNWRDNKDNIYMITERLNIDDLFTLLTKEYNEIPSGTVMGHLHLHVANMKAAKTFYSEVLGFDNTLSYGNSAAFISDQGYHHHIAYNVWRSRPLPDDVITTGLAGYELNMPKENINGLKVRLNTHNIHFIDEDNILQFNDINGATIYIKY